MPLPLTLSPAAVCQCFVLVSLCTSIADPNWIYVQNGTNPNSDKLIYGVAFTLHPAQSLNNTALLGGVNGSGMRLLYTLAALCYAAVLLSSSSFLVDFLGLTRSRLVTSLNLSTALLCLAILCVSGSCLYVIRQNINRARLATPSGVTAKPGESLFIAAVALIFSFAASYFSCTGSQESAAQSRYLSVEHRDPETERLIPEPGPEEEEWGEVFPTEGRSHISQSP